MTLQADAETLRDATMARLTTVTSTTVWPPLPGHEPSRGVFHRSMVETMRDVIDAASKVAGADPGTTDVETLAGHCVAKLQAAVTVTSDAGKHAQHNTQWAAWAESLSDTLLWCHDILATPVE